MKKIIALACCFYFCILGLAVSAVSFDDSGQPHVVKTLYTNNPDNVHYEIQVKYEFHLEAISISLMPIGAAEEPEPVAWAAIQLNDGRRVSEKWNECVEDLQRQLRILKPEPGFETETEMVWRLLIELGERIEYSAGKFVVN